MLIYNERNEWTEDKEIELPELGLKKVVILTMEQEEKFKQDGVEIHVIPVWKWLLDL